MNYVRREEKKGGDEDELGLIWHALGFKLITTRCQLPGLNHDASACCHPDEVLHIRPTLQNMEVAQHQSPAVVSVGVRAKSR